MALNTPLFYIRNQEHNNGIGSGTLALWWGQNSNGYTYDLTKAGRYTEDEARQICHPINSTLHGHGKDLNFIPDNVMVPVEIAESIFYKAVDKGRISSAMRAAGFCPMCCRPLMTTVSGTDSEFPGMVDGHLCRVENPDWLNELAKAKAKASAPATGEHGSDLKAAIRVARGGPPPVQRRGFS